MIKNKYALELEFVGLTVKDAYETFKNRNDYVCFEKKKFDVVTTIDFAIEKFIIKKINEKFPNDIILSEETRHDTVISGRTWTIDPIDGTYNYANGIPLFGVQCSLFDDNQIVVSSIYFPMFDELYTASLNGGAFLNGTAISVKQNSIDKCIVSVGDFPHSRPNDAAAEKRIISSLADMIARIRMYGAASIDFAYLASGKTNGVVIFTKNKWDISPGLLLCKEAGAVILGNNGRYSFDSNVVIAASQPDLANLISSMLNYPTD